MGPETGSRPFNKIDFILFPLVLLLRMSRSLSALAKHLLWSFSCFYNYFFDQALSRGVHQEVLPTILFMSYLGIKFVMFLIYWTHSFTSVLLCFPFELLCQGSLFWPQLFYSLFNPKTTADRSDLSLQILKIARRQGSRQRIYPQRVSFALCGPNLWCSLHIKSTVLMLTCISTTMKRSPMQSQTQRDHLFHMFGILFVYQFAISISRHCFLSLPIATLANGLLLSPS